MEDASGLDLLIYGFKVGAREHIESAQGEDKAYNETAQHPRSPGGVLAPCD